MTGWCLEDLFLDANYFKLIGVKRFYDNLTWCKRIMETEWKTEEKRTERNGMEQNGSEWTQMKMNLSKLIWTERNQPEPNGFEWHGTEPNLTERYGTALNWT